MDTLINCSCKIDLVSLYFRLLWYHSILRGSIDQNTLKQTKFKDKTVKSTQPSLVLFGLHDFLIFSNRMVHAWSVEAGNIFGISLFRPSRQSNISTSGEERFKYPLPRENKISQMPYPRDNKDNQVPTPCPAPPLRLYIDRCITFQSINQSINFI